MSFCILCSSCFEGGGQPSTVAVLSTRAWQTIPKAKGRKTPRWLSVLLMLREFPEVSFLIFFLIFFFNFFFFYFPLTFLSLLSSFVIDGLEVQVYTDKQLGTKVKPMKQDKTKYLWESEAFSKTFGGGDPPPTESLWIFILSSLSLAFFFPFSFCFFSFY